MPDEINQQSQTAKEKREIVLLILIYSAASTFFSLLFEKTAFEQPLTLATAIGYGLFILWWCKADALERKFEIKYAFRFLLVIFGAVALIYYLFKSRSFKEGLTAAGYALLVFLGIIFINTFVIFISSALFGIEMTN